MYDAVLLSGRLRNKKVIVPSVGWVTSIAPAIQLGFERNLLRDSRRHFVRLPPSIHNTTRTVDEQMQGLDHSWTRETDETSGTNERGLSD